MKTLAILPLSLLLFATPVLAAQDSYEQENLDFCTEQANLEGVTETQEKSIYITECMESMRTDTTEDIIVDQTVD